MKNNYGKITNSGGVRRQVLKTAASIIFGLLAVTASVVARGQSADEFNPSVNSTVFETAVQPDGKILIGGTFTIVNGQARQGIARLNADGTLDAAFNANVNDNILALALQPDGKILIGGPFTSVGGQPRNRAARLNADGTLDAAFNPNVAGTSGGFNNGVHSFAVQPDGKILLGGEFTNVGGQPRDRLARVNADGSLDAAFNPTVGGNVWSVKIQPDGKILFGVVGGGGVVRLNSDGTRDASFNPPATGSVLAVALQTDGKILVGRASVSANDPLKAVTRLNADGTLDAAFNQNVEYINGTIYAVAVQADGKIVAGGIISSPVKLVRLNADGTRDFNFNANLEGTGVLDIDIQTDGKILLAGFFTFNGNAVRNNVVRLLPNAKAAKFDFDGDGRADLAVFRPSNGTWYLQQSAAGLKGAQFGIASDKPAPADYDGDFKTDIAVFREGAFAYFYILQSRTNTFRAEQFGTTGDAPTPNDFDGDGRADAAVYRNGASGGAQSLFFYRPTGTAGVNFRTIYWGATGDLPATGDYDGDGRADAAVFRPSNGIWYVSRTSNNQLQSVRFGTATDRLVPADYDGDGRTDYAVFRAGTWYLLNSTTGLATVPFGTDADLPTPADYDGDGKSDIAVFRPSNGVWYLNRTTSGLAGIQFGALGDKPAPNAFVP